MTQVQQQRRSHGQRPSVRGHSSRPGGLRNSAEHQSADFQSQRYSFVRSLAVGPELEVVARLNRIRAEYRIHRAWSVFPLRRAVVTNALGTPDQASISCGVHTATSLAGETPSRALRLQLT
jgi:hypothetical protein